MITQSKLTGPLMWDLLFISVMVIEMRELVLNMSCLKAYYIFISMAEKHFISFKFACYFLVNVLD